MNTSEMQAGREMDLDVSARVFGHPYAGAYRQDGPVVDDGRLSTCPRYSTDIAAAWEVVEALAARYLEVEVHQGSASPQRWCIVRNALQSGYLAEGSADTAPLAICRAALSALEPR